MPARLGGLFSRLPLEEAAGVLPGSRQADAEGQNPNTSSSNGADVAGHGASNLTRVELHMSPSFLHFHGIIPGYADLSTFRRNAITTPAPKPHQKDEKI